jgi:hypothetical protein
MPHRSSSQAVRFPALRGGIVRAARPGYIFLVSVLVIGAIAAATTISMILLGLAAQQNGYSIVQSAQAWEYAQTCVERALRSLRSDPYYAGSERCVFTYGGCTLSAVGGEGNANRTICAQGTSGDAVRRAEVKVATLRPTTTIDTWRETASFTLCR